MSYSLVQSYAGESLLSGFDWFHGTDLSHGFVSYQSREDAEALGLYTLDPRTDVVTLGVDANNTYSLNEGRPSIRLESKESYSNGLFIADFLHMPPSTCGLWPAFWTYGTHTEWPYGGEVDIIEGANTAYLNTISAHTADGCFLENDIDGGFEGYQRSMDCAVGSDNVGCGYNPPRYDVSSYGDGFNAVGGGVYAMLWDDDYIRVWHFPRGGIPGDIGAKQPDPESWGLPQAIFGGRKCNVDQYFQDMSLVININFCGDYGDAIWGKADACDTLAPSCREWVAENPEAFEDAYWAVNYIEVYDVSGSGEQHSISTIRSQPTETHHESGGEGPTGRPTGASSHNAGERPTGRPSETEKSAERPGEQPTGRPTGERPNESGSSGRSTTTSTATHTVYPQPTRVENNPIKVRDLEYLGCLDSNSNFTSFVRIAESERMTLEYCAEKCAGAFYTFTGVYKSECFCADSIDVDSRVVSDKLCNIPCPGDNEVRCGGRAGSLNGTTEYNGKPRKPATRLLTVYGDTSRDLPKEPPAMGGALKNPDAYRIEKSNSSSAHEKKPENRPTATAQVTSIQNFATGRPSPNNEVANQSLTIAESSGQLGQGQPGQGPPGQGPPNRNGENSTGPSVVTGSGNQLTSLSTMLGLVLMAMLVL